MDSFFFFRERIKKKGLEERYGEKVKKVRIKIEIQTRIEEKKNKEKVK